MKKIVGVRFRKPGKVYFFDPDKLNIEKGQKVITNISLVLGILAVLYLALTRDAYAITVVFVLLIIKVMLLFKVNER